MHRECDAKSTVIYPATEHFPPAGTPFSSHWGSEAELA